MAIYDQPKDVDTRVRFFDGQFLVDQDFVDEQKYHLDRERRLGKMLRITGIVDGLAVSSAQPNKVMIAPGTAIDSDGRQIVLVKERTLDLPAAAFNNKSAIKLYIVYREQAMEKAKVGSESERRWNENPLIAAVAPDGTSTDTWDSTLTPVLLAQLSVSNNGAVAVDSSVAPQYGGLSLRGNVGIGTTTPAAKLQISGGQIQVDGNQKIAFTDNDVTNNLKLQLWAGFGLGINSGTLFYAANGNHSWRDNNGTNERMVLTTAANGGLTVKGTGNSSFAGNVGIGMTNPGDYKLSVNGSSRLGGITDFASNTVLSVAPGTIQFDAPNITGGRFIINGSNGNVGIGTPSPDSRLTINGNIAHDNNYSTYGDAPLTIFEPTHNGGNAPNGTRDIVHLVREGVNSQAYGNKVSLALGRYEHNATNSRTQLDIKLTDGSFNSHTTVMSLRSNGNVGIGTTNAEDALQISDFAAGDRYVTLTTQGGNKHRTGIKLWAWQKNHGFKIEHDETISGLNITRHATGAQPDVAGATALFIANFTGNVGIGTTSPGARLDVNGSIKSPMWKVTQLLDRRAGPLPVSAPFRSEGGTLIIFVSGTAFRSSAGTYSVSIYVDDNNDTRKFIDLSTNEANSHKSFPATALVFTGVSAGNHTLRIDGWSNGTIADANDRFYATVLELPF